MHIFSFRDNALFVACLIGDMVSGVLDKNQFGATAYSLTHAFFELYGGKYSGKLLSALSKIFTNFLHTEGFTLGVRDIVVTDAANQKRKQVMEETAQVGKSCAGLVTNSVFFSGLVKDQKCLRGLLVKYSSMRSETLLFCFYFFKRPCLISSSSNDWLREFFVDEAPSI